MRFLSVQDRRQASGSFCPYGINGIIQFFSKDRAVEKKNGVKSLILGRRHLPVDSQIGKKGFDLSFPHLLGMSLAVKENKTVYPGGRVGTGIPRGQGRIPPSERSVHLSMHYALYLVSAAFRPDGTFVEVLVSFLACRFPLLYRRLASGKAQAAVGERKKGRASRVGLHFRPPFPSGRR